MICSLGPVSSSNKWFSVKRRSTFLRVKFGLCQKSEKYYEKKKSAASVSSHPLRTSSLVAAEATAVRGTAVWTDAVSGG